MLRELLDGSLYIVDDNAIAEAIVIRLKTRAVVPDVSFRCAQAPSQVRSFRPHRGARSFRLSERR